MPEEKDKHGDRFVELDFDNAFVFGGSEEKGGKEVEEEEDEEETTSDEEEEDVTNEDVRHHATHDQKTHGRKKSGSKKGSITKERIFDGDPKPIKNKLSKQQTGSLGEQLAIDYLKEQGFKDARLMNLERNNFPVDLIQDHEVYEVKAGLISNSTGAQKWRLTIGEPGKKEKAWLKTANADDKAAWNARKSEMIVERKRKVVNELSKRVGQKVKLKTITMIIDPDSKKADIHVFDGSHPIIRWKSEQATSAYKGTINYG